MISRWRNFDNAVSDKVTNRRAKAYAERFLDITASDLFLAMMDSSPFQWESENTEMCRFRWRFWKNLKKVKNINFYLIFDDFRDFFNFK